MSTQQEDHTGSNELAELTGPFYDVDGLVSWLGISESEIRDRIDNDTLLAVLTVDDVMLFPVWQFEVDGTLAPDLQEILGILNEGILSFGDSSGWMVALWLCSACEDLPESSTPIYAHLRSGEFIEEIRSVALHDAMCWSAP